MCLPSPQGTAEPHLAPCRVDLEGTDRSLHSGWSGAISLPRSSLLAACRPQTLPGTQRPLPLRPSGQLEPLALAPMPAPAPTHPAPLPASHPVHFPLLYLHAGHRAPHPPGGTRCPPSRVPCQVHSKPSGGEQRLLECAPSQGGLSHLSSTQAALCSLAMVTGPCSQGAPIAQPPGHSPGCRAPLLDTG